MVRRPIVGNVGDSSASDFVLQATYVPPEQDMVGHLPFAIVFLWAFNSVVVVAVAVCCLSAKHWTQP